MSFEDLRFSRQWRDYQARALGDVRRCLADRRFRVVAAPGSGKTILGVEIVRRLGRLRPASSRSSSGCVRASPTSAC